MNDIDVVFNVGVLVVFDFMIIGLLVINFFYMHKWNRRGR